MKAAALVLALCACAAAVGPAAAPARAQDDPAALARAAMAEIEAAAAAQAAASGRRDRVAALAETVRAYESGLAALRAGLRRASRAEARLAADLEGRSAEVSRLLGALAGIGRAPPALTLVHPAGPVGTARAAMVLGEVTPALQAEAEALRRDLREIRALREIQHAAQEALATALRAAQQAHTDLSQAIADRTDLPRRFDSDPERMRDLLEASDTLAAFAEGIAALGPPAEADARTAATGALPLPVSGIVLRRFGEADAAGIARPGVTLATRPGALVVAPFDATIRYAGPLLDYGNVMILEPDAATLVVLSGLGALYGAPGQIVSPGDPLGLAGPAAPDPAPAGAAAMADATDAERTETLYMEVRRGDTPVDPAELFALQRQE